MTNNILNLIVLTALVGTFASRSDAGAGVAIPGVTRDNIRPRGRFARPCRVGCCGRSFASESAGTGRFGDASRPGGNRSSGYERVSVLGKGSDGTWRAKAYKGTSEVRLTVDGRGRVSAE